MVKTLARRLSALLLCVLLLLGMFPSAHAAETPDYEGALAAIAQAYAEYADTVELGQYHIPHESLWELFLEQRYAGAYPWYADSYTCRYNSKTGYITTLTFRHNDPNEYDYGLYEQKIAEIMSQTVLPDMSHWQIALSVHDYLAAYGAYDESYTYYQGYDLLVRGTAVCNGYAEAYMDILKRAGVPCVMVVSEAMDHAWNLVQLGNHWYHVDVTWDDPVTNREGRVLHKNFLVSDAVISDAEHGHYGWKTDIVCDDTGYDTDCFWHEVDSQIIYETADQCYFRQKTGKTAYTIYSRQKDGTQKKVTSWEEDYIDIGAGDGYHYFYPNYGLSLFEGRLYYSSMEKVWSIKPDGTGKKTVFTYDAEAKNKYIAGSYVEDGKLLLTLAKHNGNQSSIGKDLGIQSHVHSYTAEEIPADCIHYGKTGYTCQCGLYYEANYKPLVDHVYDDGVIIVQATTIAFGLKKFTCQTCGAHYTEQIPKLEVEETKPEEHPKPTESTRPTAPAIRPTQPTQSTRPTGSEYPSQPSNDRTKEIALGVAGVVILLILFRRKK